MEYILKYLIHALSHIFILSYWLWHNFNNTSAYFILLLLLLSRFSHVRLCATLQTAAHQAPPSLGFSRQEYQSGLPFPSPMHESEKWKWSRSVMSDSQRPHGLKPTRLLHPWGFPGKSTGVGCHCLLHRGFLRSKWDDQYKALRQQRSLTLLFVWLYLFFNEYNLIYLAVSGLSYSAQPLWLWHSSSEVATHRLSSPVGCGISIPRSEMEISSPALQGRFLTIGTPGKSLGYIYFYQVYWYDEFRWTMIVQLRHDLGSMQRVRSMDELFSFSTWDFISDLLCNLW